MRSISVCTKFSQKPSFFAALNSVKIIFASTGASEEPIDTPSHCW